MVAVFQVPSPKILQTIVKDLSTNTETSIPVGDLEKRYPSVVKKINRCGDMVITKWNVYCYFYYL